MNRDDPIVELEFLALRERIRLFQQQVALLQAEVELLRGALNHLVEFTNQWP